MCRTRCFSSRYFVARVTQADGMLGGTRRTRLGGGGDVSITIVRNFSEGVCEGWTTFRLAEAAEKGTRNQNLSAIIPRLESIKLPRKQRADSLSLRGEVTVDKECKTETGKRGVGG